MTIKQQGGIFGRNPTFNDVEVESLTIAGNSVPDASTILVNGDIGSTVQAYDANTTKNNVSNTFTLPQVFPAGSVSNPSITQTGDTDTGIYFPAANQQSFSCGGTETFRTYFIAGAYGILKANGSGSATFPNFTFNGDDNTGMYRATTDALAFATSGTERLRINASGGVELKTGNLVVPSGNGIDFSATAGTGTSELFDDYEEGTWAVVVKDTNSTVVTGVIAAARYTKIGRLVNCTLVWYRNDVASLTGAVTFDLPFASQLTSPYYPAYGTYFAAQGGPTYANISTGVVILDSYADNIGNLKFGYSSGTIGNLSFGAGAENLQNGGAFYSSFSYETTA
jgi:hypothetical protein